MLPVFHKSINIPTKYVGVIIYLKLTVVNRNFKIIQCFINYLIVSGYQPVAAIKKTETNNLPLFTYIVIKYCAL